MANQYYLNNRGDKWVIRPNQAQWFEIYKHNGGENVKVQRKPKYWYSLGNFCGVVINYKGKLVRAMACEVPE